MRRYLSICVFSLVTTSFARAADLDTWQSKAVDKAEPSIVVIKGKLTGTGVVIDERGYIVTNRHVISTSHTVKVRFSNGKELAGDVIWLKASYDLAIVRVDAGRPLPALAFAPTDSLKRGHRVLAIGHPFGYEFSVCDGIVSSVSRNIALPSGGVLADMIQTTTPINRGNSGGPLLNAAGELIGINTALHDEGQNIAFAINASTVKRVLNDNLGNLRLAGIQGGSNAGAGAVASASGSTTSAVAVAGEAR